MAVLSTTLCYPNAAAPTQGVFVQQRLEEIARLVPLTVVAPTPWFSLVRPFRLDTGVDRSAVPTVWHPRMFYLPGIAKRWDASFFERAFLRAYRAISKEREIRVIDAHFEWPDGVGAFRAARRLGLPLVCTLRGKLVSQSREAGKREMIVEMLKGADALISVSRSLADLANELAERDLNIRVIPNGVDTAMFRRMDDEGDASKYRATFRLARGWSVADKVVISVGHLQELKGFHRLVAVWPAVRSRMGNARLVFVGGAAGEPGYERQLRQHIQSFGLAGYVTLEGRVEPAEVSQMLNAADLFVLASRSEGWCNAIAESLACGCPVVATDVGGNREIVKDSSLGMLVRLNAEEELMRAICQGIEATWDRQVIAQVGGQRTWQQVAVECVDVLQGVMETSKSRKAETPKPK